MIRCIDTETTGTDHSKDRVIQIGSCDLTKDGVKNIQQTFVALPEGVTIPPTASAVHHIVAADLVGAPTFEAAIDQFKGADYYLAFNADFDSGFLASALGTKPEQWLCAFKIALRVWGSDAPGFSNQCLRYWLGEVEPFGFKRDELPTHAAASDTIVTSAVFHRLAKWQGVTFPLMVQWSQEPALFTVCNFGNKHKGKRYDEIAKSDPGYLEWMIGAKDMDEGRKFSARYWLDKREGRAA